MTKAEWIGLGIAGVAAGGLVFLATRGGVSAPSTSTAASGSGSNTTPASGSNSLTTEIATLQQEVNADYATVKANTDTVSSLQTQLYQANQKLAALLVSAQNAGISLTELKSQVSGLS